MRTQPQLVRPSMPLRRCAQHGVHAPRCLHVVEDRVGGGSVHLVDDVAVGEEQHAVGVGGRGRVVGDHDDGLAELTDRLLQEASSSCAGRASPGRRSARRRTRSPACRRARGPRRRAAAARRTARSGRCAAAARGRRCRRSVCTQSGSGLRPAIRDGSAMFSAAVSVGSRLNDWKMKPILSRRSSVSCLSLSRGDVGVPDADLAGGGAVEPGEDVQQGRLAGAGRSHDRGEPAGVDLDADVVEGEDLRRRPRRRPW